MQPAFETLTVIARWEIAGLFAAIWGLVGYQLLTRRINLRGILSDASGPISPIRLQLLMITLGIAGAYLMSGGGPSPLVDPLVAGSVAGGSNLVYLAHKYLKLGVRGG